MDVGNKEYEEVRDSKKLQSLLEEKLDNYNTDFSARAMSLVFFAECTEHVLRIARVLR